MGKELAMLQRQSQFFFHLGGWQSFSMFASFIYFHLGGCLGHAQTSVIRAAGRYKVPQTCYKRLWCPHLAGGWQCVSQHGSSRT